MRRQCRILILAIASFVLSACGQNDAPTSTEAAAVADPLDVPAALAGISAASLTAHLDFLASDELRGRMTGTPDYDAAAEYVAQQYAGLGLEAAGEDGWY
jgi:hypothetical protein